MTNFIERGKPSRGLLVGGMLVLTAVLVAGIMSFMSDDTGTAVQPQAAQQPLFKDQAPAGLNPAARSEGGSGGGLEMFSKTNAGYYGEEASTAPAAAQAAAAAEVKKSSAAAAAKATAAAPKAKTTVIPRMKSANFGNIAPTNVGPGGAGQGMPDISGMLKQAQQQKGN